MCTRFYVEPDTEEIREIIAEVQRSQLSGKFIKAGNAILTSGEIRPTNVVPVIAPSRAGRRTAFPMKWGFQIPGRSLLVNARVETAAEKPTFKEAWEKHRCIVPASWYYEWEHLTGNSGQKRVGDKYMIQPKGSSMTWLAGLYRIEDGLPVFTVLTKEPTEDLRRIHDRMPLILPEDRIDEWINPLTNPKDILYAFQNVFDCTFYGRGKTNYMLFESVVTNSVYYGTFFVLYLTGAWTPTLIGIALMFGIGNAFDSIVSGIAYAYFLKKNKYNFVKKDRGCFYASY